MSTRPKCWRTKVGDAEKAATSSGPAGPPVGQFVVSGTTSIGAVMTPTDAHGNLRTGARRRRRGKPTSLHTMFLVALAALLLVAPSAVASSPPASPVAAPLVAAPKVLATFPV